MKCSAPGMLCNHIEMTPQNWFYLERLLIIRTLSHSRNTHEQTADNHSSFFCNRIWTYLISNALYTAGASLEGVRGVRLHPQKSHRGCSAPLLRVTTYLQKLLFYEKSTYVNLARLCLSKNVPHTCSPHPSCENPNDAPDNVIHFADHHQ